MDATRAIDLFHKMGVQDHRADREMAGYAAKCGEITIRSAAAGPKRRPA